MVPVDELYDIDDALGVQLRLVLASPLWRVLPFGVQINPRAWRLEVLEIRPDRRVTIQVTIPWRPGHPGQMPLTFLVVIWHNRIAPALHRRLARLQDSLGRGVPVRAGARPPRLAFYDTLSHALVCQLWPCGRGTARPEGHPANRRPRRLIQVLRKNLRG